jgi:tetratricopeptide (TPR) repeat protein
VGEVPPPAPRVCFGRDGLLGTIIGLAENLTPIALVGAGGIGKTSIAQTFLHHPRIKKRFGSNRRFIRCDQFTASCANFLRRLSNVIGAGVKNPEDLTSLRPSLTSKEMLIVLDNAESILDPKVASGQEISVIVKELSKLSNVCLCITSRTTTVPSDCKTLEIPALSMEAARDTFYRICQYDRQTDSVNDILEQLDFHPLSVTLLATVAHQNKWGAKRLTSEWKRRQTGVLRAGYNKNLARTIELSLASSMFKKLGLHARGLLELVAFFPQGTNEKNLDWLFPAISNRTAIFDTFCALSLASRNDGFITMLAPLRDYLRPQDPMLSPQLCATKDRYFTRMAIQIDPKSSTFNESRWVVLDDANVEHLLDIFTSVDADAVQVWSACADFFAHLSWYKPGHTVLRQKIGDLPDDHPSKGGCLYQLAQLFVSVGNHAEQKRHLNQALKLMREWGDDSWVARILMQLSDANRMLQLYEEVIQQAGEALEIYQRLGFTVDQAMCLRYLAFLLYEDKQLDAAKESISQSIALLPEKGQEFQLSQCQRILSNIHRSKGEKEKAMHHAEAALAIASPFGWHTELFWVRYTLAELFLGQREFYRAHSHVEKANLHAVDNTYHLGRAIHLRAIIWYRQGRLGEAMSGASHALEIHEKLGATRDLEVCRALLQTIQQAISNGSGSKGEVMEWMFLLMPFNLPFLAHRKPSATSAWSRLTSNRK